MARKKGTVRGTRLTAPTNLKLLGAIVGKYRTQGAFIKATGAEAAVLNKVLRDKIYLCEEDRKKWAAALDIRPEDLWNN